ncbi:FG-GAP-like repeat-containing protein [Nocardioides humilatus]|nr:FG-GAP-like repeat-containing protein [Nocardioides humilatus]
MESLMNLACVDKGRRRSAVLVAGLVATLVALGAAPADASQRRFTPPTSYSTESSQPFSIASGDINGDGDPDVVTSQEAGVSILLGNGDGTFAGATQTPCMSGAPDAVALADLDGDGDLDLIVGRGGGLHCGDANTSSGVSVLLGNGDGTFGAELRYPAGHTPDDVVTGFFNDDAIPDVVVADYGADTVTVLLGNGDGTLAAATHFPAGDTAIALAVGDLTGDGHTDIVVANYGSGGGVSILRGNGDGTFAAPTHVTIGAASNPYATTLALADLDEDGNLDLVTAAGVGVVSGSASILLGNGDGSFGTADNHDLPTSSPRSLTATDLDGDGHQDLAVAGGNYGSGVSVLFGDGDGDLSKATRYNGGSTDLTVDDFDTDGRPDLASVDYQSHTVSVLLGYDDITAPDTQIASGPVGGEATADDDPTFEFTGDPGDDVDHFECKLDSDSYADCTSPKHYVDLPHGSHTFSVRAVDVVGNVDATPAERTWTVGLTADLGIATTDSADPAPRGGQITYTLDVDNSGPDSAPNVVVDGDLPDGATFWYFGASPGWECSNTTTSIHCTRGSLAASASSSIEYSVFAPSQMGQITNSATVTSDADDLDLNDNTSEETTTLIPAADLGVFADSSPNPIAPGEELTYTAEVTNYGPDPFEGEIELVDELPAGVTFLNAGGNGWTCAHADHTVTCSKSTALAVDATDDGPVIVVQAPESVGYVPNNVTVTSSMPDPYLPNTAYTATRVNVPVDLALSIADSPDPVQANGSLTYTIDVNNLGPDDATEVDVSGELPSEIAEANEPVPSGAGWACATWYDGDTHRWFFQCSRSADLEPGAAPSLEITVTAPSNAQEIHSTARVSSGHPDPSPANNSDTETTTVHGTDDTTPPDTQITSGPANGVTSGSADTSFDFASDPPADLDHFECRLDDASYTTCTSPAALTGLTDGTHTFSVRAVDAAGNTDPTPASRTWTVDNTPPDTEITSGPADGAIVPSSATYGFAADPVADFDHFECKRDATAYQPCTSPKTYSDLPVGTHTLSVRAVDLVGNADPTPASRTWTVSGDHTAPDTQITSGPEDGSTTADRNPSFAFTATPPADLDHFECQLNGGPFEPCTSPKTYTDLPEASYVFAVRAVDASGNADPSPATRTWTVGPPDTTAPDTQITSGPADGAIVPSSATFGFAADPVADFDHFECKRDTTAYQPCTSPKTYSDLPTGTHTLSVRAVDLVGNADPTPATRTWTVSGDHTAPDTQITSGPEDGTTTFNRNPSFAFTATPPSDLDHFECQLNGGPFETCVSPKPYTDLPDASYVFAVRAVDASGNADPSPATRTWTVGPPDTTAPDTQITSGPAEGSTSTATVSFGFAADPVADFHHFECKRDRATYTPCASPTMYFDLTKGSHTFSVRAVDIVGNADPTPATRTWTVDTTPPNTKIGAVPKNGSTTSDNDPTLTFKGTPPADVDHFECKLDFGAYASCTSPTSYADLADGSHTFTVRAVDAAGNVDRSPATRTWTIDTTPPDTTITSHPDATIHLTARTAKVSFEFVSNDPNATFECRLDTAAFVACKSPKKYSAKPGQHTFEMRAVDKVKLVDPTPASFTFTFTRG